MIGEAAAFVVANAVDLFQTIGAFQMSKSNPWSPPWSKNPRNAAFAECVSKLEKSGVSRPAALDVFEEILDTIERIEREDAFREEVRKAGGRAASQS
jgi:hypothetical protein